jgi:hypothetical protein
MFFGDSRFEIFGARPDCKRKCHFLLPPKHSPTSEIALRLRKHILIDFIVGISAEFDESFLLLDSSCAAEFQGF